MTALLAQAGGAAAAWAAPEVTVISRSGAYEVRGDFTTHAPLATAWEVLTDYGGIPSFVNSIKKSEVERRADDSLLVHQVASVGVFPFRFTAHVRLVVNEQPQERIAFEDVLGEDFRHYAGAWSLRADSGSTVVRYTLEATPRSNSPAWFGRSMMSHSVSDLLLQVHREIERRAKKR